MPDQKRADGKADVALLRLPAPGLRGTFAKAYHLLTLLASKIGWDELLKTRSQVFVMEEEYRLHKTHASVDLSANMGHDDASSTAGMKSPAPHSQSNSAGSGTPSEIPTIRISTESARTPNPINGDTAFPDPISEEAEVSDEDKKEVKEVEEDGEVLERPETVHEKKDVSGAKGVLSDEGEEGVSAFSNKRLCERWLGESPLSRLACDGADGR
jgi:hypothetical protein